MQRDSVRAAAIFLVLFGVYLASPVHQVTDSHYSLLLSEQLIRNGSFHLDSYFNLPVDPKSYPGTASPQQLPIHVEAVAGHIYYYFPPGSSILSAPYVRFMNLFGISTIRDGRYDARGELMLEAVLAALLMAAACGVFYLTARLFLSPNTSVVIAIAAGLGTQLWSTASRALWSSCWQILLFAVSGHVLARMIRKPGPAGAFWLGTLLSCSYWVRPTSAIPALFVTLYIWMQHRRLLPAYLGAFAVGIGLFFVYSFVHFGNLLPAYYLANRLTLVDFPVAFAGNLVSPARGLLVFVPSLLWLIWAGIRFRWDRAHGAVALSCLGITGLHLLIISMFPHWWGGYCFGPRFSAELVPWLVLVAVLIAGRMNTALPAFAKLMLILTLVAGGIIHGGGALSGKSMLWNVRPADVDTHPARLWDWKDPQFLAFLRTE